jgi:FkbM family methyltransferase
VPFFLLPEGAVPREMWSGMYFEQKELDFIVGVLEPGMTFVDIGANVGLFSIPAAKKVQHGKVFAFEAASWSYERLLENSRLNSLTNLGAVHCAIGDCVGTAMLQINAHGKDGLNTLGRPTHSQAQVVGKESVSITTLDRFLQEHSILSVDVMKVDVEGAELMVFRGAKDLLHRQDAPLILYESGFLSKGFDYHPVEQVWLLQSYGFSLFVMDAASGKPRVPSDGRAYNAMVIAIKPSHGAYARVMECAIENCSS